MEGRGKIGGGGRRFSLCVRKLTVSCLLPPPTGVPWPSKGGDHQVGVHAERADHSAASKTNHGELGAGCPCCALAVVQRRCPEPRLTHDSEVLRHNARSPQPHRIVLRPVCPSYLVTRTTGPCAARLRPFAQQIPMHRTPQNMLTMMRRGERDRRWRSNFQKVQREVALLEEDEYQLERVFPQVRAAGRWRVVRIQGWHLVLGVGGAALAVLAKGERLGTKHPPAAFPGGSTLRGCTTALPFPNPSRLPRPILSSLPSSLPARRRARTARSAGCCSCWASTCWRSWRWWASASPACGSRRSSPTCCRPCRSARCSTRCSWRWTACSRCSACWPSPSSASTS